MCFTANTGGGAYGYNKNGLHDNYGAHHAGKYGHLLGSYGNHGNGYAAGAPAPYGYGGYPSVGYPGALPYGPAGYGPSVPYAAAASAPVPIQIAPVGPSVGLYYKK